MSGETESEQERQEDEHEHGSEQEETEREEQAHISSQDITDAINAALEPVRNELHELTSRIAGLEQVTEPERTTEPEPEPEPEPAHFWFRKIKR